MTEVELRGNSHQVVVPMTGQPHLYIYIYTYLIMFLEKKKHPTFPMCIPVHIFSELHISSTLLLKDLFPQLDPPTQFHQAWGIFGEWRRDLGEHFKFLTSRAEWLSHCDLLLPILSQSFFSTPAIRRLIHSCQFRFEPIPVNFDLNPFQFNSRHKGFGQFRVLEFLCWKISKTKNSILLEKY